MNRKAVFTCLANISDCHSPLTVGASTEGQVKLKRSSQDVFEVKDFSKTYELLAQLF